VGILKNIKLNGGFADPCQMIKQSNDGRVFASIYVDDIILDSNKNYQMHTIVQKPMSFLHANPPISPSTMVALETDGSTLQPPHPTLQPYHLRKTPSMIAS